MKLMKVTLSGFRGLAPGVTDASAATCEALRTFSIKQGTITSTWAAKYRGGGDLKYASNWAAP